MAKKAPIEERLLLGAEMVTNPGTLSPADFVSTLDLTSALADAGTPQAQLLEPLLGQERALAAVRYAVQDQQPMRHLFLAGPSSCGKRTMISQEIRRYATQAENPRDLVLAANFADLSCPSVIALAHGTARAAVQQMEGLLFSLQSALRRVLSDRDVADYAVEHAWRECLAMSWDAFPEYAGLPTPLQTHLQAARAFLANRLAEFQAYENCWEHRPYVNGLNYLLHICRAHVFSAPEATGYPSWYRSSGRDWQAPSQVPIVYVHEPGLTQVFGEIIASNGAYPDHTLVRPGALHRANGGFLVINAQDILSSLDKWAELKLVLRSGSHDLAGSLSAKMASTPIAKLTIPINLKVVLVGPPALHQQLAEKDPDFLELFPIKAEFDDEIPRDHQSELALAQWLGAFCQNRQLPHFTPDAVNVLIEYSSRLVEDQKRLSLEFRELSQLALESASLAQESGTRQPEAKVLVERPQVEQALANQTTRSNLVEERLRSLTSENVIRIDTTGEMIGQVNGLTVIDTGDYEFGRPVRITARYSLNKNGMTDIERDCELGGKIHSKGLLILNSFICASFANKAQLPISLAITLEQNYDEIEGDSASSAEAYAVLSAMAHLPLRQGVAVTGSIDQYGNVQAIGGVNEKIECFFDACVARKLTRRQGVIIPSTNVAHLMLHKRVRNALAAGKFSIWAVNNLEEGIEILSGVAAGKLRENRYPKQSVYGLIQGALDELNQEGTDNN